MAIRHSPASQEPPPELVAGGAQWSPVATAALVGGAIAATAGAYFGTRALARRNARNDGKPLNSVMANAITACDLAHHKEAEPEPGASHEPAVAIEPPEIGRAHVCTQVTDAQIVCRILLEKKQLTHANTKH